MDKFKNSWFIIPARKGSKGVPLKNRYLIDFTINSIPLELRNKIIVSTDDDFIIDNLSKKNIKVLKRDSNISKDETDTKVVIEDVINRSNIKETDLIFMLYTVWPERTFKMIEDIFDIFIENNLKSLLCSTKVKTHPYMTFYSKENNKGKPLVKHDLYRRQDYPECFVINHLVTIFETKELKFLNKQFYNDDTHFHPVEELINIDSEEDLNNYNKKYQIGD